MNSYVFNKITMTCYTCTCSTSDNEVNVWMSVRYVLRNQLKKLRWNRWWLT